MLRKKVSKVSSANNNSTGYMNVMGGKFAMNGSPLRGNEKSSGRFPLISYSST